MSTPNAPARVNKHVFEGLLIGGTVIALCFLIFRLFVKIKSFKKLFADDFIIILSWVVLLAYTILWKIGSKMLFTQYAVASGEEPFYPEFIEEDWRFIKTLAPATALFYTGLWTVKLQFLLFFRRLGTSVTKFHQIYWWCVLAITISTYIVCIADIMWRCTGETTFAYQISYCVSKPFVHLENATFFVNMAVDIISDCCIMVIPFMILWNVRIATRKKMILFGIFSLTIFVMILAIVRVVVVYSSDTVPDISWLYLWSGLEMQISIIIGCIASFRQLFVKSSSEQIKDDTTARISSTGKRLLSYFRSKTGKSSQASSIRNNWPQELESQTHIVPLNNICVTRDYHISSAVKNAEKLSPVPAKYSPLNDRR